MFHHVPDEWKPRLRRYLLEHCGEEREILSAFDFDGEQSVHVKFADGSFAKFQFAFAIPNEANDQVMVFTEHCGYHVFPVNAGDVKVVRSSWLIAPSMPDFVDGDADESDAD